MEKEKVDDAVERFEAGFAKARKSMKTKAQADILMRKRQSDSSLANRSKQIKKGMGGDISGPPMPGPNELLAMMRKKLGGGGAGGSGGKR